MENVTIDPLASIPADAPPDVARDHIAAIVKGSGVSLEDANRALASRNAAPLVANSKEMAEQSRANLLNDSDFVQRYERGDPEAIAKLFQADLRVQQTTGKLLDHAPTPADYSLKVAAHLPGTPEDRVQNYSNDLATLASAIQLPKENAQALTDAHFAAIKETAILTKDEQSLWGQNQTAMLHSVLGVNAEDQIAAATATLAKTGRTLNIADIANSNGAEAAVILIQQAQFLARQKR